MDIKNLTAAEKAILTLAVRLETTQLTMKEIHEEMKLEPEEAEKTVHGLAARGMAEIKKEKSVYTQEEETVCILTVGISGSKWVDLKEIEEQKWSDMELRDRICP